jgi:nucleoside-diphosphate-sugar epimerase
MIIGITGSRGFAGAGLAQRAIADGHAVRHLDRPVFSLERGVPDAWLRDVDMLVHCAFDFQDLGKNILGSKNLFAQARRVGVKTTVLLSSLSVNADSEYGKTKKQIEQLAAGPGVKILRPGLIYEQAPGGLLGRIIRVARHTPVLPIIRDSEQYTTHIEDLYRAVLAAPEAEKPVMAAASTPVKLEKIITRYAGKRIFIPISFSLLYRILTVLEAIHLSFGLRGDNLKGLHYLAESDFDEARRLGLQFRKF